VLVLTSLFVAGVNVPPCRAARGVSAAPQVRRRAARAFRA
jgi:hypothetical protein